MTREFMVYIGGQNGGMCGTSSHYGFTGVIDHLLKHVRPGDEWSVYYDGEKIAAGMLKHYPEEAGT